MDSAPGGDSAPVHEPRTFEQIAEAQYGKPELPAEDLPAGVAALRDTDPARRMYDDRTPYTHAGIERALADHGVEGPAADLEHKAWAGVFADLGLSGQDAQGVVQLAMAEPPSDDQVQAWPTQAQAALQEAFGRDWQQALADARLLVARDPRLSDYLNRTGLGNHPHIVKLAAERARAAIANGTLKRRTL